MPVFFQENRHKDTETGFDKERIIVPHAKEEDASVVCLDRVDHISKQPVLGVYKKDKNVVENNGIKDYRVEAQEPYRIADLRFPVFSQESKNETIEPTYKKIVVIDSTTEALRIGAYASHYKMVETVCTHDSQFEVKGFDVGIPGNAQNIDYEKYLKVLSHLDTTYEWGPIKVLNLSFVRQNSYPDVQELLAKHYTLPQGFTLNKENIGSHSEAIYTAILKESQKSGPDALTYADLIKEVHLLSSLMNKGVSVVMSAGNSGDIMFDIRAAMLPDLIVVGGLDKSGNFVDPRSANSSLIDTWEPFVTEYSVRGVPVTLEGTSFSAPRAARKVADMQGFAAARDISLTNKDINTALHAETIKKFKK